MIIQYDTFNNSQASGGLFQTACYGCDSVSVFMWNLDPDLAHNLRLDILEWKPWDYDALRTAIGIGTADQAGGTRYNIFGVAPYWTAGFGQQVAYANSGHTAAAVTTVNGVFWHTLASWSVEAVVYQAAGNLSPFLTSSGTTTGFKILLSAGTNLQIQRLSNAVFTTGPAISANTGHHVVIVNDAVANTIKWYVDGNLQTTTVGALAVEAAGTGQAIIEGGDTIGNVMQGFAGQFGVYSKALTAADVSALYLSLTRYWRETTLETISVPAASGVERQFGLGGNYPMPAYLAPWSDGPAQWKVSRRIVT